MCSKDQMQTKNCTCIPQNEEMNPKCYPFKDLIDGLQRLELTKPLIMKYAVPKIQIKQ